MRKAHRELQVQPGPQVTRAIQALRVHKAQQVCRAMLVLRVAKGYKGYKDRLGQPGDRVLQGSKVQ